MNLYEKFYTESLYPIQDGVIRVIRGLHSPLYLTGGTALSRGYFNHRYSDDLDFFVNSYKEFNHLISDVIAALSAEYRLSKTVEAHDYMQIIITVNGVNLKVDLVNDIAVHHGDISAHDALGRIDGLLNILTNKMTALYRYEPKDVSDILEICRNFAFTWNTILSLAGEKEAGVQPALVSEIIKNIPVQELERVKWAREVDYEAIKKDLDQIAWDILEGGENRLKTEA